MPPDGVQHIVWDFFETEGGWDSRIRLRGYRYGYIELPTKTRLDIELNDV